MISAREVSTGIFGAWLLARYNSQGLQYFDNNVTAFWRSFYAALIALPAYAIIELLRLMEKPLAGGALGVLVIEIITYVIGWTLFPLIMFHVARLIGREEWFCRYIAAYNWSLVIVYAVFLMVTVIAASGLLPLGLAALMTFVVTVGVLAYQWYIARVMLALSGPGAGGIVLLDLVISVILDGYVDQLLRGHGILG